MFYFKLGTKFKKVKKSYLKKSFLVARGLPPLLPLLVNGPLKKDRFFAASLSILTFTVVAVAVLSLHTSIAVLLA